jgi:hypothetical protein
MNLEKYGYSSITGVCFNPFGVKPREIQEAAAKLRHYILVDDTEDLYTMLYKELPYVVCMDAQGNLHKITARLKVVLVK